LMDAQSGDLGGVPTEDGKYTLQVSAFHGADTRADKIFIEEEIVVRHRHEIVCQPGSTNFTGPPGKTKTKFTCNCLGGFDGKDFVLNPEYAGDNCETTPEQVAEEKARLASTAAKEASDKKASQKMIIALAGAFGLLFLAGLAFAGVKVNAYREKMRPADFDTLFKAMVDAGEIDPEEAAATKKLTPREIKRAHLNLVEVVGHGQFGEVWKGMLDETNEHRSYLVAAKTVLDAKSSPEATLELEQEAIVMAHVGGHPNLVSLIGVITRGDPLVLIISYCEHGSLLSMLRKRASEGSPLYLEAKLKLGLDTAKGMEHLQSKHFVHRDLAARNVLVATGMVGQVADFGLSRGIKASDSTDSVEEETEENSTYYKSQTGIFPVRWTAPESMELLKFSAASDVWSFAITLVELYQDGVRPYDDKKTNAEVMTAVMAGKKHDKPEECSTEMYAFLTKCLSLSPEDRPNFGDCVKTLGVCYKKEKERPRMRRRSSAVTDIAVTADGYLKPDSGAIVSAANPTDNKKDKENEYTEFGFGADAE